MDPWLRQHLVCPRDQTGLRDELNSLVCLRGHRYSVVRNIPILLVDDAESTHDAIRHTLRQVEASDQALGEHHPSETAASRTVATTVDPFVQAEVPYTCGILYFAVQHQLARYPIPELRLPHGDGARLLDLGCNWGRWSISAGRAGYRPVGIDPSLDAVLAAQRVCAQLGIDACFVVGDARYLPFAANSFEVGFSYGVLQHFSKENARTALDELSRVTRLGGKVLVQMPNKFGVRSLQQRWRRGFSEGEGFEVRYWGPSELLSAFDQRFGSTTLSADCFFGLGLQGADRDLLPLRYRLVVSCSEGLRRLTRFIPSLARAADSVYLEATLSSNQLEGDSPRVARGPS